MKNTFVKVLSFMMALTMIVGAFGAITVSAAACAHENRTETAVVAPTCATAGFTSYKCNDCGETFIDGVKSATGKHTWKDVPASKATCDEYGYAAHKVCTTCPEENPATDPAVLVVIENKLGHVWNIPCKQEPTCSEAGYTSLKCARCNTISEDPAHYTELAKVPHDYQYAVTAAPTNCVSGKITVTCSACDYNNVIDNKNTHTWKNMDVSKLTDAADVTAVTEALTKKGIEFGDTCGDDYKEGEICIVCLETQKTKPSTGTCTNFVVIGAADGFKVTALNYKPEFATVDGKTFAVGSVTKVDATHAAAGWQLVYCNDCKTYDVQAIAIVAHDYTGTGSSVIWKDAQGNKYPNTASAGVKAYNDSEYHTIAMTKYNVCSCGAEKAATGTGSTKADTKHNYDWKVGDVQMGKVVVAADCVNNGTITWNCKDCVGGDYVELNGVALGHTYGEWSYVDSYTCGDTPADGQMVRSCTRKYGNNACALDGCKDYKKADANKTHAYAASIKTAATCVANAVYEWKCSDCGDIGTKPENVTYPVSGFNANNHVEKGTDPTKAVQENVVAATCTTNVKHRYLCECGKLLDLEEANTKLGHTAVDNYHADDCKSVIVVNADGSIKFTTYACVSGCKEYRKFDATCQYGGVSKAGQFCSVCKADIANKTPTTTPKNNKNHTVGGVEQYTTDATCVAEATVTKYYSCCGIVDTVKTGTTKNANNHVSYAGSVSSSMLTFVAKVPATCVATGTVAHYTCSGCKKVVVATHVGSGETKDDYTAGALDADNKADTIAKLATNGKHDFTGTTGYQVPAKAETCTAKGSVAYTKCKNPGCTYIQVAGKDPFVPSDGKDADDIYDQIEVAPHGTTNMGWHKGVEPTCTVDGYKFKDADGTYSYDLTYCCSKCDRLTVGKTNHANSDFEVINNPGDADYLCTLPTYEFHVCPDCGYSFFKNYKDAAKTAHTFKKYADGDKKGQDEPDVTGTPTCTNAAEDIYKCQNANCTYSEKRAGAAALGHKIKVNGIEIAVDFGCTSEDHKTYKGFKCSCGAELGVEAKYEHNIAHAAPKAPTCTTSGNEEFDFCVDCGKLFVAAGVDVTKLEKPALGHSASSTLISTENGVETLSCPVCGEYWTKAVDAEAVETLSADKIAAGEKATYTFAVSGKVEFSAVSFDLPFDTTLLTFNEEDIEVNADLAGLYGFATVKNGAIGITLVAENDAEGNAQVIETPVDGTTVLFTITFTANKTASGNATVGNKTVEIASVGNLNGDAFVTAADAQAIFAKVGSNDAAADVNNDGIVNFADVAALAKFVASNKTAKDYLVMVGEYAAIEAEVYALLDAGRLANHDGVASVINVNDALALIAKIETGLAGAYATLGNNVTAAAVVAYYNAK